MYTRMMLMSRRILRWMKCHGTKTVLNVTIDCSMCTTSSYNSSNGPKRFEECSDKNKLHCVICFNTIFIFHFWALHVCRVKAVNQDILSAGLSRNLGQISWSHKLITGPITMQTSGIFLWSWVAATDNFCDMALSLAHWLFSSPTQQQIQLIIRESWRSCHMTWFVAGMCMPRPML